MLGDTPSNMEPGREYFYCVCVMCGIRTTISSRELAIYNAGNVVCGGCGGKEYAITKRTLAMHKIQDPVDWAYEREVQRFEAGLAEWLNSPQGAYAVYQAEIDRKAS